jgi:peptidoglycan/LPS O-acetylase OafA/YrhL
MHSSRASADPRISEPETDTPDTGSDGPPLHEEPVAQKHRFSILDHLSRKTTSGRFIPEIDSLRFFAIAMVVLYHLAGFVTENDRVARVSDAGKGWFYDAASYGHYGVQLFFMISGFVLALPFASHRLANGRPVQLRAYFLRRLTRLEPPYILAMVGFALILIARHRYPVGQIWTHLGASLLYVHNLVYSDGSLINVVAWSLEIEVQFYCLAPLMARLFAIRRPRLRRGLILLLFAVSAFVVAPNVHGRWSLTLLAFLHFFLVGFLAADLYVTIWRHQDHAPWWWRGPQVILRSAWLATIGGMCYTIYLLHYPLISFVGHNTLPLGQGSGPMVHVMAQGLLILPVVLVVSSVYFVLIERPCMDRNWPGKLRGRVVALRRRAVGAAP